MQQQSGIERKGILAFLIITFVITYAIEGVLIASGFRFAAIPGAYGQLVVAVAMWVPTVATLVTVKFVTHEKPALGNLRFGSWKPYLASGIILPVCFALIYGVTWATGSGSTRLEAGSISRHVHRGGRQFSAHSASRAAADGAIFRIARGCPFLQWTGSAGGRNRLARVSLAPLDAAGQSAGLSPAGCDLGLVAHAIGVDRIHVSQSTRAWNTGFHCHDDGHWHLYQRTGA